MKKKTVNKIKHRTEISKTSDCYDKFVIKNSISDLITGSNLNFDILVHSFSEKNKNHKSASKKLTNYTKRKRYYYII